MLGLTVVGVGRGNRMYSLDELRAMSRLSANSRELARIDVRVFAPTDHAERWSAAFGWETPTQTQAPPELAVRVEMLPKGLSVRGLAKAWKVAREYRREQIDALGELIVEHRARFGPTHLTRLLAVTDRKRRDALARAAIRGRWGVTRLERKIQAEKRGRRPLVGKKPVIPDVEPELLAALGALADKWVRWVAAAEEQIPDDLTDVLSRATAAVTKVKSAVAIKLSESE